MGRFISRKVLHVLVVLLVVTFALTFLIDLTPGDPAYAILGETALPEQVEQVHEELGLDEPVPSRYAAWLTDVMRGDFGSSYRSDQPVGEIVAERLPVTAELALLALVMALAVSIPVGVYTAYRADGRADRLWTALSSTMISSPPFVTALVLVYLLALGLRDTPFGLPATGWVDPADDIGENLRHAFLPASTLALILVPQFSRLLRADMIATLREDYILAARGRGIPTGRILLRHALRPSSLSLVTLAGVSLGALIGGSVIVETLFAVPGIGGVLVEAIASKDIPVVQGVVMFIAVLYVVVNALLDVAYHLLDPRVRVSGRLA